MRIRSTIVDENTLFESMCVIFYSSGSVTGKLVPAENFSVPAKVFGWNHALLWSSANNVPTFTTNKLPPSE